jgi:dienelactone hydrolase
MSGSIIEYYDGDVRCQGEYFAPPEQNGALPVVLVVHAWDGPGPGALRWPHDQGMLYNQKADTRSWRTMLNFFAEVL